MEVMPGLQWISLYPCPWPKRIQTMKKSRKLIRELVRLLVLEKLVKMELYSESGLLMPRCHDYNVSCVRDVPTYLPTFLLSRLQFSEYRTVTVNCVHNSDGYCTSDAGSTNSITDCLQKSICRTYRYNTTQETQLLFHTYKQNTISGSSWKCSLFKWSDE